MEELVGESCKGGKSQIEEAPIEEAERCPRPAPRIHQCLRVAEPLRHGLPEVGYALCAVSLSGAGGRGEAGAGVPLLRYEYLA